jgi:acyl-coenzyme A thioesterase PaaI-like protein
MANSPTTPKPPAFSKLADPAEPLNRATTWVFAETSLGPFGSVFGGVVGALMVEHARATTPDHNLVAAASFDFARPTMPGEALVAAEVGRTGRRMTSVNVTVHQEGKLTAQARVMMASDLEMGELPQAPWVIQGLVDPAPLPSPPALRPQNGKLWLGDVLEARVDGIRGISWFTRTDENLLPLSPAAFGIAMADYAAGVSRPDDWLKPVVSAFPNPLLFTSLVREPQGRWAGLRARSLWDGTGIGVSHADLLDEAGTFGFAEMVCLLLPLEGASISERRANRENRRLTRAIQWR